MTTILVINAVSSCLASVAIGGFFVRKHRQDRTKAKVQPAYVDTGRTRPLPRA
jgi:hypothetical protein